MVAAILAGTLAMLVLSWLPLLGPLLAGFIAGLAAQGGGSKGAAAGTISGALAGLILGGLIALLATALGELLRQPFPPHSWDWDLPVRIHAHIAGGLLVLGHCLYFSLLGALGGWIGGTLVRRRPARTG
ncbi:MAG: hypothetical protein EYC70_04115 [Planctomycetota bacterium]|nr:MAG: hypothetical protein EYC70_04115 [Planctomycetota bacterium]